jgi:hypothetical protein
MQRESLLPTVSNSRFPWITVYSTLLLDQQAKTVKPW